MKIVVIAMMLVTFVFAESGDTLYSLTKEDKVKILKLADNYRKCCVKKNCTVKLHNNSNDNLVCSYLLDFSKKVKPIIYIENDKKTVVLQYHYVRKIKEDGEIFESEQDYFIDFIKINNEFIPVRDGFAG
jgi:hypothetical protein